MPKYDINLDEKRATPEQKKEHHPMSANLKIGVYSELKKLGYELENTLWGEPFKVSKPISEEHKKVLETSLGVPLKISEI